MVFECWFLAGFEWHSGVKHGFSRMLVQTKAFDLVVSPQVGNLGLHHWNPE